MNAVRMPAAEADAAATYTLSANGYFPTMEFERGTGRPVFAFRDDTVSQFMTVAVLPATGGAVAYLGSPGMSGQAVSYTSIMSDASDAVLAACVDSRGLLSIFRFASGAWSRYYTQPSGTLAPTLMHAVSARAPGSPSYLAMLFPSQSSLRVAMVGSSGLVHLNGGGFTWRMLGSQAARVPATVARHAGLFAAPGSMTHYNAATTSWPDINFGDDDRRSTPYYASDSAVGWAAGSVVREGSDPGKNGYAYQTVASYMLCSPGNGGVPGASVSGLRTAPQAGGFVVRWDSPSTSSSGYRVVVAVYDRDARGATSAAVAALQPTDAGVVALATVASGTSTTVTGLTPGRYYQVLAVAISPGSALSVAPAVVAAARASDAGEPSFDLSTDYRFEDYANRATGEFHWNKCHAGKFSDVLSSGRIASVWSATVGNKSSNSVWAQVVDPDGQTAALEVFSDGWDWVHPSMCAVGNNLFAVSAVIRDLASNRLFGGVATAVVAYDPDVRTLTVLHRMDRAMAGLQSRGGGTPDMCKISDVLFAVAWADHHETTYTASCGRRCTQTRPMWMLHLGWEVFNAATGASMGNARYHDLNRYDTYYPTELCSPRIAHADGMICVAYQRQNTVYASGTRLSDFARVYNVRVDTTGLPSWTTQNNLPNIISGRSGNTFLVTWSNSTGSRAFAAEINAAAGTMVTAERRLNVPVGGGRGGLVGPVEALVTADGQGYQLYASRGDGASASLESWTLASDLSVASSYSSTYFGIGVPALSASVGAPAMFVRTGATVRAIVRASTAVKDGVALVARPPQGSFPALAAQ